MKFGGIVPQVDFSTPTYSNGHWQFPERMGDGVGFIYVIRDNVLQRFYLGKKSFSKSAGYGDRQGSGWRYYTTSSKTIAGILTVRPMEEFDFICLEQYNSKSGLSYAETWTLCFVEAPTSTQWYNTRIEKVSWAVKEGVTERHKRRLADTMAFKDMR